MNKDRKYYVENKNQILIKQKQRRAYLKSSNSLEWVINRLYWQAKNRSKEFNIDFNLDKSDITVPKFCPVLGIELVIAGPRYNSPSLDRIYNSLGYIKGNVAVISNEANRLKNNATLDQLKSIVRYMEDGIDGRESKTQHENQEETCC